MILAWSVALGDTCIIKRMLLVFSFVSVLAKTVTAKTLYFKSKYSRNLGNTRHIFLPSLMCTLPFYHRPLGRYRSTVHRHCI